MTQVTQVRYTRWQSAAGSGPALTRSVAASLIKAGAREIEIKHGDKLIRLSRSELESFQAGNLSLSAAGAVVESIPVDQCICGTRRKTPKPNCWADRHDFERVAK